MGAITSNANPPHNELVAMRTNYGYAPPEGFLYNWQQIIQGKSKSFAYNTFFSQKIGLFDYGVIIMNIIISLILINLVWLALIPKKEKTI
jgi:hypothetical protein